MNDAALHGFLPDAGRGRCLDARMHRELAASLAHLATALSAAEHPAAEPLDTAAARIDAGQRVGPEVFARYYQIAEKLLDDDVDGVEALARTLAADTATGRRPFAMLGRGHAPKLDELLDARMGAEAAGFAPVTPDAAAALAARVAEALALMAEGVPELHAEITAIVHAAMAATSPPGAKIKFDGASHYQFWGLLLLNPEFHPDRLAMAEVLAHESAHSLLFGLTIDEPLVTNPDEDLFPSPLRLDPRPMDGIYHATFVSARMAWAMEAIAASGLLTPDERDRAAGAAATDRANFASGLSVIDAHGALSPTGAAVIGHARRWIAA